MFHADEFDVPLANWAGKKLGIDREWDKCRSFGIVRGNDLVGVIVFSDYRRPNVEATIWSSCPYWATPSVLRVVMRYAFLCLDVKRITATTDAANHAARKFLCRLGFRQEGVHPDALPTGDAVTYGLLRKSAGRWLSKDHE